MEAEAGARAPIPGRLQAVPSQSTPAYAPSGHKGSSVGAAIIKFKKSHPGYQ